MKRQYQEFAGRTKAEALKLARRYGYTGDPVFIHLCAPICVVRFEAKS